MRVPKDEKISFRIKGELFVLDIHKEFTVDPDKLGVLPRNYAYFKELEARTLERLRATELEKDRYYASQFLVIKEDGDKNRPPSDKWVNSEILEDEEYLALLEKSNQAYINYKKVAGLVRSYQTFIDVSRTLVANAREEFKNS